MTAFGVHSEVGKLRQVIVHRPELSLQRLTPDNHDELLFDDVLWVERAQWEHDQFVARMRERGVEVFYVQDLLAEALAADQEARSRLTRAGGDRVRRRRGPGGRGPGRAGQLPARQARPPSHRGSDRGRVGPRPGHAGEAVTHRRGDRRSADLHPAPAAQQPVHPRLVVLDLRRRLDQPDVLAGAAPRGVQHGGHLPRPSHVPRRGVRLLVPAHGRGRSVQRRGLRARIAGGRRRRDHRQRRGGHRSCRSGPRDG